MASSKLPQNQRFLLYSTATVCAEVKRNEKNAPSSVSRQEALLSKSQSAEDHWSFLC